MSFVCVLLLSRGVCVCVCASEIYGRRAAVIYNGSLNERAIVVRVYASAAKIGRLNGFFHAQGLSN